MFILNFEQILSVYIQNYLPDELKDWSSHMITSLDLQWDRGSHIWPNDMRLK